MLYNSSLLRKFGTATKASLHNVNNMSEMFSYCSNLTKIPELDTSNVTDMAVMFEGCSNLTSIPKLDTSNVFDMSAMFRRCTNLDSIPELDTSGVGRMDSMFYDCSSLRIIPKLDLSNNTSIISIFYECDKLSQISLANTWLEATKIDNVFNELPTVTSGTIDITGNPGVSDCDRSIATKKGWTVRP